MQPDTLEACHILAAFHAEVGKGPVFVSSNMEAPNHENTNDPLVRFSPLIRVALAAAELGAKTLVFDRNQISTCVAAVAMFQKADSPDLVAITEARIPCIQFHWCTLNSMLFVAGATWGVTNLSTSVPSTVNPNVVGNTLTIQGTAKVDPKNPAHLAALELVLGHFKAKGWSGPAERLGREIELLRFLGDPPGPSWEMGESYTHADALAQVNATAQRWLDEAEANGYTGLPPVAED